MAKKKGSAKDSIKVKDISQTYKDGGKIATLESEIKDIEEGLASPAMPESLKADMKKTLDQLHAEVKAMKELPEAPATEKKKEKKTSSDKDSSNKKKERERVAPKFAPEKSCAELQEMYEARRNAAKKARKEHKTVSVSEQIGSNLAKAVGKAIDAIPAANIKASPKKYISALENLEKGITESIKSFRVALGDDYDRDEILEPIEEIIGKFIKNVKDKYSK